MLPEHRGIGLGLETSVGLRRRHQVPQLGLGGGHVEEDVGSSAERVRSLEQRERREPAAFLTRRHALAEQASRRVEIGGRRLRARCAR